MIRSGLYFARMPVRLTPAQRAFVRAAIASGKFDREEDAIREAQRQCESTALRARWATPATLAARAPLAPETLVNSLTRTVDIYQPRPRQAPFSRTDRGSMN